MITPPPRIFPEQKDWLQFDEEDNTGYWYLYDDYTEIMVYGIEEPPYYLLVFPTMRIFSLEFIRQTLKAD